MKGLAKFLLGVFLALAILLGGSIAVALFFLYRVSTPPPKPVFANDKQTVKAQNSSKSKTTKAKNVSQTKPKPTASKPLAAGTYKARVTWSQGLSLRSEPSLDAERIGGLDYNQQIIVLQQSSDKNWQKVRLADGEQVGWIKTGNIERVEQDQ